TSREEIVDMYCSGNYIFFGGEFSGSTMIRNMGRFNFWLMNQSINRPFISFDTLVPTSFIGDSDSQAQGDLATQNTFSKSEIDLISISPNPTSQNFVLQSFHTSPINRVRIYTIEGNPINIGYLSNVINNIRTFDLSNVTNGIYLVEILHD